MPSAAPGGAGGGGGGGGRLIDLSHIKRPLPTGAGGAAPAPVRERVAWSGGNIVSNAQEATVAFLRRRLAAGAALTDAQKACLDAHRDLVLAVPLPAPAPALASAAVPALSGGKRRREAGGAAASASGRAPPPPPPPAPAAMPLSSRLGMSLDALVGSHARHVQPGKKQKSGGGGGRR